MKNNKYLKNFLDFYKIIIKNKNELIKLAAEETGSPIKYHELDLNSSLEYLKSLNKLNKLERKYLKYEAKGKCLIIPSANQPLALIIFTVVSALFYGNQVILRPSKRALLISRKIVDFFYEAGISNIDLNLTESSNELLSEAILSREFNVIVSFASNKVNNIISKLCASSETEFIGENEGYDWVYVDKKLPYSINRVVRELITGVVKHNGQMCDSVRGVIVHPDIYEDVKNCMIKELSEVVISTPLDKRADLGFLLRGTESFSDNYFHDVHNDSRRLVDRGILKLVEINTLSDLVCTSGPFSPIVWLNQSLDISEVVFKWNKVNDFGLSFSVYSARKKIQDYFIRNIKAGRITVNKEHTDVNCLDPWGGVKRSGFGGPVYWFERFTNHKFISYGKK